MFSDPVVGERFFGRSKILNLLTKRMSSLKDGFRQNIAILGPKLIGKSSLILQTLFNFNQPGIIPIYIELRPNSYAHFGYKFLGGLLYHYLKHKGVQANEELSTLKKCAQNLLPGVVRSVEAIEKEIRDLQFDRSYEQLLSLTAALKQESGISCILILDEFHLLDTFNLQTPFSKLAREIMLQKDTMYILLSSQPSYAQKILSNELSLLFGNFEIIHLQPFDYLTCCKFLEKRFQQISLPRNLRDFLIAFSSGCPFYLDILSNKIKEKARELNREQISLSLLGQALNSLIYDSRGILNQYFTSLLNTSLDGADYANFMPVLLSASTRGMSLYEMSRLANRQSKIIAKQVKYLLDKDLLKKVGMFYRIQDRIFRFWLRSVYQRKSLSLTADPLTESKDFSREIEEEIINFSQEVRKKLTERVIELFRCFRNEIITLQNKTYRFCHFEDVQTFSWGQFREGIIARYQDKYWICLVRKDGVGEAQIREFAHYCRHTKYKIRRAIIISGKELDLNARLLALEKKIWVWLPEDLNLLLDLYGQQQIVSQW